MKRHLIIILIFVSFICSCSEKRIDPGKISVINYGPTGSIYTDPTGKTYVFRSIITNIINESGIPVDLQMNFSNEYRDVVPGPLKLKVFILPDTMVPVLQRKKQYGLIANHEQVSSGLEHFLNTELKNPSSLKKVLEAKGGFCTMNIGMLFDPGDDQENSGIKLHYNLFVLAELFMDGQKHTILLPDKSMDPGKTKTNGIDILFGINSYPLKYYSSFTCGQITVHK